MATNGKQAELDGIFSKMSANYGKLNDKQVASAIKEIGRVRGDVAELLAELADKDGTIKRQRLSRILGELDGIEESLRENGTIAMKKVINESSAYATSGMNAAAVQAIGIPMISAGIEKLNKGTVDYVMRRFGEDGLVLSDRIWSTSGEIRDSIASVLRTGIIRGDAVGTMVRDVRKAYDAETWKIKRLVVTEGNTAYRVASANSVRDSEVADYVRINENGSRHGNHTNHKCYKLAKVDKYGEGNGVYKPTDTEIYMPHPQCSSYITAVLKEEYLTGNFGGNEPQEMASGKVLNADNSEAYRNIVNNPDALKRKTDAGDVTLSELLKEQGFDGKPRVVTSAEMDALIKNGWSESFRGVTDTKFTNQFRDGDLYAGYGVYGNGTYSAYGGDKALSTARKYAGVDGGVMRMALNPNAKVIDFEDLSKMYDDDWYDDISARIGKAAGEAKKRLQAELNMNIAMDKSGVLNGYDAIRVPNEQYYVILNRTSVAVQNVDIPGVW